MIWKALMHCGEPPLLLRRSLQDQSKWISSRSVSSMLHSKAVAAQDGWDWYIAGKLWLLKAQTISKARQCCSIQQTNDNSAYEQKYDPLEFWNPTMGTLLMRTTSCTRVGLALLMESGRRYCIWEVMDKIADNRCAHCCEHVTIPQSSNGMGEKTRSVKQGVEECVW